MKTNLFHNKHSIEMELQQSVRIICVIQSMVHNIRDFGNPCHSVTKPADKVEIY